MKNKKSNVVKNASFSLRLSFNLRKRLKEHAEKKLGITLSKFIAELLESCMSQIEAENDKTN